MNALCCCEDILLPSLIKYFVKLSEKIFFLFPANSEREGQRGNDIQRLSCSLPPSFPKLGYDSSAKEDDSLSVINKHNRILSLVHATGAASAGFRSW